MFFEQMHPTWQVALADQREFLVELELACIQDAPRLAPRSDRVMRAFETPVSSNRVLVLGQDPYPTEGDAVGLAFAVAPGVRTPPSLRNILIELETDLGLTQSKNRDISVWQSRGILMLNRHLTTLVGETGAHTKLGWAQFTDAAIKALVAETHSRLVAILWGNHAQTAAPLLEGCGIVASAHPSPLSARKGFFGSKPFSKANALLIERGLDEVDWSC